MVQERNTLQQRCSTVRVSVLSALMRALLFVPVVRLLPDTSRRDQTSVRFVPTVL
jgi:hypothetical protein